MSLKNNKSLGQHWLKNREVLEEIAELALDASASENSENRGGLCVEIGPGLGTLTSSLLRRFEKVIAVEYDADLARKLPGSFPGKNLEVVHDDILGVDLAELTGGEKYVIAGNIPYYITSPIIAKILEAEHRPTGAVLLMQKEVVERILSERETVLSLFVKNRAFAEAGPVVLREEFTPPPKVDSQVLVLRPHAPEVPEEVFKLIKQAFRNPRKKLKHTISGIPEEYANLRPEDLHLQDYQKINNFLRLP